MIVDTLVATNSRETHAYQVARSKLVDIASALVPPDRFEGLFSRVMSLVPPTDLQGILGERPLAPLSEEETRRVMDLVTRGFENWRSFHDRFSSEEERIRQLDPGSASWEDVSDFARRHLRAEPIEGFEALAFRWEEGEAVESTCQANVLRLGDGQVFACGDFAGMPVTSPDGSRAEVLGVNRGEICDVLRTLAFPSSAAGAAHVLWPDNVDLPEGVTSKPFGVWLAARTTLRWRSEGVSSIGTRLVGKLVGQDGYERSMDAEEMGELVRALLASSVRRQPPEARVVNALAAREDEWIGALRTPSEEDRRSELRHAIFPLLAGVVA